MGGGAKRWDSVGCRVTVFLSHFVTASECQCLAVFFEIIDIQRENMTSLRAAEELLTTLRSGPERQSRSQVSGAAFFFPSRFGALFLFQELYIDDLL